jgi:hypothetical protein
MRLYTYQQQYLSQLPPSCIMAAETGTGKTVMALAHAKPGLPYASYSRLHSKSRTKDWEREADRVWLVAGQHHRYQLREGHAQSYDSMPGLKGAETAWWMQYLKDHDHFVLIADEIHKAKNPQSLTGKGVFALAQSADQFIGLSATPLPNGWVDICNYGKIFDWWKNKTEFFRDYVDHLPNTEPTLE